MHPVFIIAEIGQAHDGSLGILHSFIDAAAETGADAVKFQTHIAEAESSAQEPFRVKFSYEDQTRFDYWRRMGFTAEQWQGIKAHCDEQKIEFLSSPFSCAAVDLLENLGVRRFKIGSGEVSNHLMLEKIARTGKDILLSSGMSSFEDLDETIALLKPHGNRVVVLQCTTAYPTGPADVGLNVLGELRERYGLPVGLSDHSGTIYPSLAAVALGAEVIEVHVTFDRRMFGPDGTSSLLIREMADLVRGIRYLEQARANPMDKWDNSRFKELREVFGKSLAVNRDLPKGHVMTADDLEGKKPLGQGIPARQYREVLNKKLNKPLARYAFLTAEDIV